jgi:hypothetical protein
MYNRERNKEKEGTGELSTESSLFNNDQIISMN